MTAAPGRLRVMHVIEAMHQGGAESLVVEHVRLAAPDVESWVVALNRGGPALEAAAAAGAHTLTLGKLGRRLDGLQKLARLARDTAIDVIHGHNTTGGLYGALAGAMAAVKAVVRTEHSIHYPGRHSAVYPMLEIVSTLLSRRVVCVCEAVRLSHVRRLPWAAERFVTVANGISPAPHITPRETVRAGLGLGADQPLVVSVGSLTPQKAQSDLVAAFAEVRRARPEARLLIAGEGPLRADLEAQLRTLGLEDAVMLPGARLDAPDLIAAADVFALSSVREGLSVTVLEAMRAARPVVATRVGGNPEAVAEGDTGLIVPPRDPGALAVALLALLGDPERARAMGERGAGRWRERFTAERMVRELERLYREALSEDGRVTAGEAAAVLEAGR